MEVDIGPSRASGGCLLFSVPYFWVLSVLLGDCVSGSVLVLGSCVTGIPVARLPYLVMDVALLVAISVVMMVVGIPIFYINIQILISR